MSSVRSGREGVIVIVIIVVVVIWSVVCLFVGWFVVCKDPSSLSSTQGFLCTFRHRGEGGIKNLELGIESGRKKQHVEGLGWGRGEGRGL